MNDIGKKKKIAEKACIILIYFSEKIQERE